MYIVVEHVRGKRTVWSLCKGTALHIHALFFFVSLYVYDVSSTSGKVVYYVYNASPGEMRTSTRVSLLKALNVPCIISLVMQFSQYVDKQKDRTHAYEVYAP